MKFFRSRSAIATAIAATAMMTASPVFARGYGGWGHYRHRDRVDAGDILAGVLIIGGIAAIASAASKSGKDRRDRDYRTEGRDYPDTRPDYREESGRYGDYRDERDNRGGASYSAIDGAVSACVGEVERGDRRVESVDSVNRNGEGWTVQGEASDGRTFACDVDEDGRIRRVAMDGRAI
jgi:gas vesicle protein